MVSERSEWRSAKGIKVLMAADPAFPNKIKYWPNTKKTLPPTNDKHVKLSLGQAKQQAQKGKNLNMNSPNHEHLSPG